MLAKASTLVGERVEWFSDAMLERLSGIAADNAEAYQAGNPFPHIVIDDFLPPELLEPAARAFPSPSELSWFKFADPMEKKLTNRWVEKIPPDLRDVLHFLNSAPVLNFLERLTGIPNLIADSYFEGGGLHQIQRGGKLGVHADFNLHYTLNLDRRLNLLLYLNHDWKEEYGGALELWDQGMTECMKTVAPAFNRCVIFNTTATAYHGHPHPLKCPPTRTRNSIATYYYTNGRPDEEKSGKHNTLFQKRPGLGGKIEYAAHTAKRVVRLFTPPIVYKVARAVNPKRGADKF